MSGTFVFNCNGHGCKYKKENLLANSTAVRKKGWRKILLLVILAVAVLGAGVLGIQVMRSRKSHMNKAALYFNAANYGKAIEEYRLAIAQSPDNMDAREGLIRAMVFRKDFEQAGQELDEAIKMGMEPELGQILRGALAGQRADHRLSSEGAQITVALINTVIAEDIEPAVIELQAAAEKAQKRQETLWSMLGEMLRRKQRMLSLEWGMLRHDLRLALDLSKSDEVTQLQTRIDEVLQNMVAAQEQSLVAYRKAIETDPEAVGPRIAVAEQAIWSYVPKLKEAREVLAPLMAQEEAPSAALSVMAIVERIDGNTDKSIAYLNELIARDPNRYEYLVLKTEILLDSDKYAEATPIVAEMAKLRPEDANTHYEQGRICMSEGRYADAIIHLQAIFATSQRSWPQARLLLAQSLLKQGSTEQGVMNLRRVLDDSKASAASNIRLRQELLETRYNAYLGLASHAELIGSDDARDFAAQAFRLFPTKKESFEVLVDLCRRSNLPQDAIEAVVVYHAVAMAREPNGVAPAMELCDAWIANLSEASNNTYRLRTLKADVLALQGNYREAVLLYEELWKEFPDNPNFGIALGRVYSALGKVDQVKEVLSQLHAKDPGNLQILGGLVMIQLRSGDVEGAKALLSDSEKGLGRENIRELLIGLLAKEGNFDEALVLARELAESKPNDAPSQVILARILWQKGELDAAAEAFNAALAANPKFVPGYMRALLDVENKKAADAVELLRRAEEQFPGEHQVIASLAVALYADGQADEAVKRLAEISAPDQGPNASLDMPRRNLMFMLAGQGKFDEALKLNGMLVNVNWGFPEDRLALLRSIEALDDAPGAAAAGSANLIGLYASGGLNESALKEARKLHELVPENPLAACWVADLIDNTYGHNEAVAAYSEIIKNNPGFLRARLMLAESHQKHDEPLQAARLLEESIELARPDQAPRIHLQLAGLNEKNGDLDQAVENYKAAVVHKATAAAAGNNLAWLLAVKRNDPSSALPYAERALEIAPQDPSVLDTYGWVLHLNGKNAEAAEALLKAREALPAMPTVRYHLGVVLMSNGDVEKGKAELQEALTLSEDFPEAAAARQALLDLSASN